MRVLNLLRADVIEAERNGEELRYLMATAKLAKAEELVGQGERLTMHYQTMEMAGQQALEDWRVKKLHHRELSTVPELLREPQVGESESATIALQAPSKKTTRKRGRSTDVDLN